MALKTTKKQPQGFTLVELMVVLVILGIISVGTITAITGQSKVYHSEEDLIDMQMNARVAMERITFLLRMSGVNCSDSFGNDLTSGNMVTHGDVAANPLTAMFTITNNTPSTSDQLTLVGASRRVGHITSVPANNQIKLDCNEYPKLEGTVSAKSYIAITPRDENRYQTISAISSTTTKTPILTLTNSLDSDELAELTAAFAAKDSSGVSTPVVIDVYQVQAFSIRLVNSSLRIDENISLSSTQLDVADNIQDLQFQYGIDTGSDGQIDSWVDNPTDITQIRAVRVFILARTGKIDKTYTDTKTYTLAGVTVGPFTGTNLNDLNTHKSVHRHLLESTISVRNRNF